MWGTAIHPALSRQEMLLSQTNLGHGLFPLGTPSGPQLGTALLPVCPMRQPPSSGCLKCLSPATGQDSALADLTHAHRPRRSTIKSYSDKVPSRSPQAGGSASSYVWSGRAGCVLGLGRGAHQLPCPLFVLSELAALTQLRLAGRGRKLSGNHKLELRRLPTLLWTPPEKQPGASGVIK